MTLGALLLSLALPSAPLPAPALPDLPPAAVVASNTSPFAVSVDLKLSPPSLGEQLSRSLTRTGPRPYFGARYYGSKIGRFTTVDPVYNWTANLLDPQRWNRYAYGRNNPLRYVDPDGKDPVTAAPIIGGLTVFYLLNNPTPANVTTGPSVEPIVPNSVVTAALFGAYAEYSRDTSPDRGPPDAVKDVNVSRRRSPEAARHIEEAQAAGHPDTVTIDRRGARPRRRGSLEGLPAAPPGFDRDEYPPACCAEGGAGACVRPIPRGDNRSAGGQLGQQIKDVPDGSRVRIKTKDE